jgi:hypothetical protein
MKDIVDQLRPPLDRDARPAELMVEAASEISRLKNALMDATAHLAGATSAYEHFAGNSKRAGVRDALYSTRLSDFKRALERARAELSN